MQVREDRSARVFITHGLTSWTCFTYMHALCNLTRGKILSRREQQISAERHFHCEWWTKPSSSCTLDGFFGSTKRPVSLVLGVQNIIAPSWRDFFCGLIRGTGSILMSLDLFSWLAELIWMTRNGFKFLRIRSKRRVEKLTFANEKAFRGGTKAYFMRTGRTISQLGGSTLRERRGK